MAGACGPTGSADASPQHAQSQEQRHELDSHAREIREELGGKQPDKSKLIVILERIASSAKSIAPIVGLAMKLKIGHRRAPVNCKR